MHDARMMQEVQTPERRRPLPSPLIGRDQECEQLFAQLDAVSYSWQRQVPPPGEVMALVAASADREEQETWSTSAAQCLFLVGEAGIGKTRLAHACRDQAEALGWG